MRQEMRKTGIDIIGDTLWGTHICQFYQTKEDLSSILVPYFKAGLENNEFCMWVTSKPLDEKQAQKAMKKAVPDFDRHLEKGQIEILPHTIWYRKDGAFDLERVLGAWIDKLNQAVAKGYDGMRISGNAAWLEKQDWSDFTNYEKAIHKVIGKHRILAICTYALDQCRASEVLDVVANHQCTVIERGGKWELIESSERKRAEEALRRREQEIRVIAEGVPALFAYVDAEGHYRFVNNRYEEWFGVPQTEIIGKHYRELLGEAAYEMVKDRVQAVLSGNWVRYEDALPYVHGGTRWVMADYVPDVDDQGTVKGFFALVTDITERKRAEEALRESEERYRHIFEQSSIGIGISTLEGQVVTANKAMQAITGYSSDELRSISLLDTYENKKERKVLLEAISRYGAVVDFPVHLKRKDGTPYDALLSVSRINLGGKDLHHTICQDITERKRAEEAMHSKIRHISTVRETAQSAMDADKPQELARSILRSLSKVMPVDAYSFTVCNPATNELVEILQADIIDGAFELRETSNAFTLENNPLLSIVKSGKPVIELRKPGERIATQFVPFGDTNRLSASLMFAPMCHRGVTKGIVSVQSYAYNAYSGADLALFADVANVAGVAVSRLMAEDNLRKSEEIYRKAISFAEGVAYQRDYRLGAFTFVGEGITKLTGYSLEEFNTGVFYKIAQEKILRGELAGVEFDEAMRRVQTGQVNKWQADYRILTRDGKTRWISDSAVQLKDSQGKVIGSLGILQDVTERKQAEEELRHVHQIYRGAIENAQGVPYRLNHEDGTYEFFGKGCEELIGISPNEVSHEKFRELVKDRFVTDPEGPSDPFEYVKAFRKGQVKRFRADIKIVTPKGEEKWLSDCSLPIFDEKTGHLIASLGILQDITERKRAEQALRTSEEQLRQSQKMEAIGRLAGGLAHDFNNLLTAITGYAELLLNRVGDRDPLRRDIEEIYKAAEAAASLTRRLLAFGRRQVLQPMALDLNVVIADMEKMLRRMVGEDVTLVTVLDPNLDRIKADRGQIEQVIMNLTVNARDAMPEGGKLMLKTKNMTLGEEASTCIPEARPGKFVCLAVTDTGSGMEKEVVPRIFEPFFTTKKSEKGTGLGLSVVYGIVKQHEGWINVYSEPGQGSTFDVYLPTFSLKQKNQIKETTSLPKLHGHGERILLVEDEQRVREFTSRVLRENGYGVVNAANAQEALEIFEREQGNFQLVFSDVVLPDKSGYLLGEQLLSRKPELGILLCSGYADQKAQWPLIHDRRFRFLQKPYVLAELLQAIRQALQTR